LSSFEEYIRACYRVGKNDSTDVSQINETIRFGRLGESTERKKAAGRRMAARGIKCCTMLFDFSERLASST